jgi:hypothetical protein
VACGGFAGVSDTFASALWALDFLPSLSKRGVERFNFHGGPSVLYTPIGFGVDGALQVRPLWYGLRLFAELTANWSVWVRSAHTSLISGSVRLESADPRYATSAPSTDAADPTCTHGRASGSSCCASSCGACGGGGCEDLPGGTKPDPSPRPSPRPRPRPNPSPRPRPRPSPNPNSNPNPSPNPGPKSNPGPNPNPDQAPRSAAPTAWSRPMSGVPTRTARPASCPARRPTQRCEP